MIIDIVVYMPNVLATDFVDVLIVGSPVPVGPHAASRPETIPGLHETQSVSPITQNAKHSAADPLK